MFQDTYLVFSEMNLLVILLWYIFIGIDLLSIEHFLI